MFFEEQIYCRLEFSCFYKIKTCQKLKRKNIYDREDISDKNFIDVYVEEYNAFKSVKKRILEINKIWRERYPEKERYWTEQERNNYLIEGITNYDIRDKYISVTLYNRWGNSMVVGVTYIGWIMPGFTCYTLEYENNKIIFGNFDPRKERTFIFLLPEWTEFCERDFISEEAACFLIKEWLDTGQYTECYYDESGELKTRKYDCRNS